MYRRKDEIKGVVIPVLVIGVPVGVIALGMVLGVSPNVQGGALLALLVGFVGWRIYVARHPDGWPLAKKVLRSFSAQGFKGFVGTSREADSMFFEKDGFALPYSNDLRVWARMNEETREVSLEYTRTGGSWLRREEAFDLTLWRRQEGEPLVVNGKPTDFRFQAKTSAEKRFAAWIGRALGEQILSLPLSTIEVEKSAGDNDPEIWLHLTIPDGTFAQVGQVVAGTKDVFWKVMGAVDAERTDNWLK